MERNVRRVNLEREAEGTVVTFETVSGSRFRIVKNASEMEVQHGTIPGLTIITTSPSAGLIPELQEEYWGLGLIVEGGIWLYSNTGDAAINTYTSRILEGTLVVDDLT